MVKPIVLPITYKSDPKGLRRAQADLKSFSRGVGKAVGGAVAATAAIGAVSVKAFADFDSAMQQSIAIMGDVSDTMRKEMSDAAREVAKTTTFSAEQAAESYFFLASAGLDAQQSIAAMPQVAKFAQAGMFDMATATDLATDAQSALGLTSDDASENLANLTRVTDVFVKANTLANTSVQQISEALTNKAGAALKVVGKDLEEGAAVLAVFADQGVKGTEAGEKLNIALRDITRAAGRSPEKFKALGIEVFDAEGNLRNMADVVDEFTDVLGPMSDETAAVTLEQLGLTRGVGDAIKLLLGSGDAIREYESELRKAGGTTEEVADKQLDTMSAQFSLLGSEITDVGIMIGQGMAPTMKDLVTQLRPVITNVGGQLIPAFRDLAPVLGSLIAALPGLVQSFLPLIPTMVKITEAIFQLVVDLLPVFMTIIEGLLPMIQGLAEFLAKNAEILPTLVISIGGLVTVMKGFNAVVRTGQLIMVAFNAVLAMNPITLIVMAVIALTAALIYFFTQTEIGQELWANFTEFFMATIEAIGIMFSYIFTEWFPEIWSNMVEFFTNGWDTFKDYFFTALEAIGDFFTGIINGWISLFEDFINFVIGGINKLINGINSVSIDVPETKFTDAFTIGFNIPNVPSVSLPRLAEGGIVDSATIAMIGEAGPEAVIPLDKLDKGGSTYNITVQAGVGDPVRIGEEVVSVIKRYERVSGPVFAGA